MVASVGHGSVVEERSLFDECAVVKRVMSVKSTVEVQEILSSGKNLGFWDMKDASNDCSG